jgi:hypothetical protein
MSPCNSNSRTKAAGHGLHPMLAHDQGDTSQPDMFSSSPAKHSGPAAAELWLRLVCIIAIVTPRVAVKSAPECLPHML